MSEHGGAEVSKTQLHLRVSPELVALLDSVRGPATRNAYAAMLLERALVGQAAESVAASWGEGRSAAREVKAPRRTLTVRPAPAPPPPDVVEEAIVPIERKCKHPNMYVRKGQCPDCGQWVSGGR